MSHPANQKVPTGGAVSGGQGLGLTVLRGTSPFALHPHNSLCTTRYLPWLLRKGGESGVSDSQII